MKNNLEQEYRQLHYILFLEIYVEFGEKFMNLGLIIDYCVSWPMISLQCIT